MARPAAPVRDKLLTDVELELMNILWSLGGGTVQDVLDVLPPERPLARTSVSTMLRVLESKAVLRSAKEGRAHVYAPQLTKQEYEERSLQHVLTRVFDGDAAQLVMRLVETSDLDLAELEAVRAMLKKRGAKP